MQGKYCTQQVIQSYQALASNNLDTKRHANNFLINLLHRDQAWTISQQLILNQNDANYQVLGSQILYQKVSQQLQDLSIQAKCQLRNFIFGILENQMINVVPLIDKLASALSLIICTMVLKQWNNFMIELMEFMKKSPNCLKNGLFLLQRLPQQLRNTNRIAIGLKRVIIDQFFKYQQQMADIFLAVLTMNPDLTSPQINKQLIKRDLNAMQSWSKSRFSFLKYPQIIKQILIHSLQDFDKFEHSIIVIIQTIKSASINKQQQSIDSLQDPTNALKVYTQNQILSIKLILQYIEQNKNNFMTFSSSYDSESMLQPEHRQAFLDIIKQSVLNFGFLMLENIGFQLLDIVLYFTNSSDLRMSCQTFQFWIDMSEKMADSKNLPENVRNQFSKYMIKLFEIVNSKAIVESDYLLDDPELKEDVTVDDSGSLTFGQYRKQCNLVYQYIYNYYLKATKSPTYFFQTCFSYILKDLAQANPATSPPAYQFHKQTQLALFCLKSSQQSMVSAQDSLNLRKILKFILQKVSQNGIKIKARVSAEVYLLISQCTRQIKQDSQLIYQCLKFCMGYILDEVLCFYASRAFKSIVQAIDYINNVNLVGQLIQFYGCNKFPMQGIVGQMLEGVFGMIQKLSDKNNVPQMLKKLINNINDKFQKTYNQFSIIQTQPSSQFTKQPSFYIPLLEFKTLLASYLASTKTDFIIFFKQQFQNLANMGLKMLTNILPYCLNVSNQKYVPGNQLSMCCSIFKSATKICLIQEIDVEAVIGILECILGQAVLSQATIVDMCPILGVFTETLTTFTAPNQQQQQITNNTNIFNNWLTTKLQTINQIFFKFFQNIEYIDPDIIKWFFTIQQSLILYNSQIFFVIGNQGHILDAAIHCIRHINQQKMQRKIISCLLLCCRMNSKEVQVRREKILSEIFGAIPIINSINFHNLSKIFLALLPYIQAEEKCAQFILHLLFSNPYTTLPQNIRSLLAQSFYFCARTVKNQRYLMIVCRDMQDIVINGLKNDNQMQLELRLNNWKRQAKRNNKNTTVNNQIK